MLLRTKIFLLFAGMALALSTLFFLIWIPSAEDKSQQILQQHLHDELAITSEALVPLLLQNQYANIHESLDALLENNPTWVAIELRDGTNNLLYPLIPSTIPTLEGYLTIAHDLLLRGQHLGTLILTADHSEALNTLHKQNLELFTIFAIGLTFGLMVIAILLDRFVRRPAMILSNASERLSKGDYTASLPNPTHDEIGGLTNSFKSMRDAIRDNEMALQHAREQFEAIITNTAEAIITAGEKGQIETFNPAAERIFGYSAADVIDRNLSILIPQEHWGGHQPNKAPSDSQPASCLNQAHESEGLRKDGTLFPIEVNISYMKIAGENKLVGIIRDITERRKAEATLRKLSSAVEQSPVSVVITDNNGIIEYVNPAFEQVSGYTIEEAMGNTPRVLKSGKHSAEFYETLWSTITSGKIWSGEIENKSKNGNTYWESVSIAPIFDASGNIVNFVGLKEEITERKALEASLRASKQEADSANHAKSEFLSSMSHELRTPLNAILGFAQLLEADRKQPLSDRQKGQIRHVIKGGEHLLKLINEVLDLAKIEAGKLALSIEPINTRSLLNDCLSFAKTLATKRSVTIEDRCGDTIPTLLADHLRSKQAILNLLSNAVKYNSEGGTVWLDYEQLGDNRLRISITDTGQGIPEGMQANMFQPFSRLGAEATEIEGTGIGLVLTKKLVEKMNGTIGFKSTPGEGSTFWIDLPIADEKALSKSSQQRGQALANLKLRTNDRLLLYVEDNPANLALMEDIVEEIPNLTLLSTHTAEMGLALAETKKPDIIILDINLPGMDGIEAIKQLKRLEVTKDIPVLALSANAMPSAIKKGLEAGFSDYLTKPINIPDLMTALQDSLGNEA